MRTRFDGDGLVDDVAFDLGGRGEPHLQPAHPADHAAIDHNIVGHDLTPDGGGFAHGQQMGANVAFDALLGAVPVVGDAFDLLFRSNSKNLKILRKHLDKLLSTPSKTARVEHHPAVPVDDV